MGIIQILVLLKYITDDRGTLLGTVRQRRNHKLTANDGT